MGGFCKWRKELPGQLFYSTGIPVSLWIMRKGKGNATKGKILFIDARNLSLLKLEELNASFHKFLIVGVPVPYQKDWENRTYTTKLIDFTNPEANDFTVINQYTVIEYKNKRPDLMFHQWLPCISIS